MIGDRLMSSISSSLLWLASEGLRAIGTSDVWVSVHVGGRKRPLGRVQSGSGASVLPIGATLALAALGARDEQVLKLHRVEIDLVDDLLGDARQERMRCH
jgi:hypothetical protein